MRSLALIATLATAGTASAEGQFQVEPTRIDLSTQAPAGAVTVTNHGSQPLRLEAKAFRWSDDIDGVPQLVASPDVVIRPSLLEIAPGGSKTVRVGTTAMSATSELTYRVFLEELPDPKNQKRGQITVLTRIGVPVFVAPKTARAKLEPTVKREGDKAVVTVKNTGTQHSKLVRIKVAASHGGTPTWQHETAGWYVLAGADRRFYVDFAHDGCGQGDALVGEVIDEDGHTVTTPLGSCEP